MADTSVITDTAAAVVDTAVVAVGIVSKAVGLVTSFGSHYLMSPDGTATVVNWILIGAAAVCAFVFGKWQFLDKKVVMERTKKQEILARLFGLGKNAVRETFTALVDDWKRDSADGVLTKEETARAQAHAISVFIESAKNDGLDAAKEIGAEFLPDFIEQCLGAVKNRS